jgi:transcription antitermination factor NusG
MSCLADPLASCTSMRYFSEANWYAVYTNARHEKVVADHLTSKNIEVFLPTIAVVSSWKDRKMKLHKPAFPSYVFTKICLGERGRVISVPGVVRILSFNGVPIRLDEAEIENIRLCQRRGALMESRPLFSVGERVRVKSGVLEGLEGFVSRCKDERRLIVPLSHINQSVAVQVDIDLLEPAGKIFRYKALTDKSVTPSSCPI